MFKTPVEMLDEEVDTDCKIEECMHCGRQFQEDRLSRHQAVCQKRKKASRQPFNAKAQRLAEGAEATKKVLDARVLTREGASREQRCQRLKRQSEALRQAIKVARPGAAAPAPSEEVPDDRVQCPHCNRRFAPLPAERHIAKCKEIRAKPTTLKRMSMAPPPPPPPTRPPKPEPRAVSPAAAAAAAASETPAAAASGTPAAAASGTLARLQRRMSAALSLESQEAAAVAAAARYRSPYRQQRPSTVDARGAAILKGTPQLRRLSLGPSLRSSIGSIGPGLSSPRVPARQGSLCPAQRAASVRQSIGGGASNIPSPRPRTAPLRRSSFAPPAPQPPPQSQPPPLTQAPQPSRSSLSSQPSQLPPPGAARRAPCAKRQPQSRPRPPPAAAQPVRSDDRRCRRLLPCPRVVRAGTLGSWLRCALGASRPAAQDQSEGLRCGRAARPRSPTVRCFTPASRRVCAASPTGGHAGPVAAPRARCAAVAALSPSRLQAASPRPRRGCQRPARGRTPGRTPGCRCRESSPGRSRVHRVRRPDAAPAAAAAAAADQPAD